MTKDQKIVRAAALEKAKAEKEVQIEAECPGYCGGSLSHDARPADCRGGRHNDLHAEIDAGRHREDLREAAQELR